MATGGNVKTAKTGFYHGWMVGHHPHILTLVTTVQVEHIAKQRGISTLKGKIRAAVAYQLLSLSYHFTGDVVAEAAAAESRWRSRMAPVTAGATNVNG